MSNLDGFTEWFAKHDWWHENSRRDDFREIWLDMSIWEIPLAEIEVILDAAIQSVRDEYE
jgi:hypothetical protein